MTQCSTKPIEFSRLSPKKIQADFDGGTLTSDGGAVLLREVDRGLGLIDAINAGIPDPRNQDLIVHQQRTLLAQRIFGITLGYEDLNDHQTLREDPLFQTITERGIDQELPLASPPTLCRLENRVTRKSLAQMAEVFVEQFINSHRCPPRQIILDFDATDDAIHGNQEGRFFHGYYDHYCFLPLYVFCGKQLLVSYLRPSKIDAAKHTRAILKLLVRRFRQVWPEVRIIFRGDSGFCRWRLMRWCDKHDVGYIIGLAKNPLLLAQARKWRELSVQRYQQTLQKGANTRFIVTNLPGDPQELYDDLYCQRVDMENRIKEQQLYLFADRTSCHEFLSNQFRLMLSSAAYVLMETMRRVGLKGTELAQAQVSTIRLKLLKIGARVRTSVRRIVLHLASGYPLQNLFYQIVNRLKARLSPSNVFR
jgi:hypothetical protein